MNFSAYSDGFFAVNAQNGFLPQTNPLQQLPESYAALQQLIDDMPILKDDGTTGLLGQEGGIEAAVNALPDFLSLVAEENDPVRLQALFRSYAFIASAYTLAPAHFAFLKTGKYGKAHNRLPAQVARPFVAVSEKLQVFPWLDYHYAYSLGNYKKIDPEGGFNWENLGMCAKFSGMPDERGFIMLHVDINQYSPQLIAGIEKTLQAKHADEMAEGLTQVHQASIAANERRKLMWEASRWKHYNDFRVFIMGITGNEDIFGEGLIYEGISEEYRQYRGQTGAQDNIIPTLDIFSGIINFYPKNELTQYLLDLRQYRPVCIQRFLEDLRVHMTNHPLLDRLVAAQHSAGFVSLLGILDEVYAFRNGHWQFVQKYIMSNTVYPKATGGTPIISWIPNQLKAVLATMQHTFNLMPEHTPGFDRAAWLDAYNRKEQLLDKQLRTLHGETYDADEVFDMNAQFGLEDHSSSQGS